MHRDAAKELDTPSQPIANSQLHPSNNRKYGCGSGNVRLLGTVYVSALLQEVVIQFAFEGPSFEGLAFADAAFKGPSL